MLARGTYGYSSARRIGERGAEPFESGRAVPVVTRFGDRSDQHKIEVRGVQQLGATPAGQA
jgi:hypothetical protein